MLELRLNDLESRLSFKGSVWLDVVVELRTQSYRETFQDSFKTYETFLRCKIVQQKRKYNL